MTEELKVLQNLKRRYAAKAEEYSALVDKVDDLIDIEMQNPENSPEPAKETASMGNFPRNSFAALTKGDAAEQLFKEQGNKTPVEIFTLMRARKHSVTSVESLRSMLSTDKRFEPKGDGIWGLKQPELPIVEREKS